MKTKFGRYFMILFSIILLFGMCRMVGCKGSFAPEPVPEPGEKPLLIEPCEKDGVVQIIVSEDDTTAVPRGPRIIDSLAISETLNALDMTNAVKMTFPQTAGVSFFFFGNFTGMENKVGIWHENYAEKETYIKYLTNFDMLRHNGGTAYFMNLANTLDSTRILNAYAIAFDDDNDHAGDGYIVIQTDVSSDTFRIDAARNTVNYLAVSSKLDFSLSEPTIYYEINCRDKESFQILKHDAVWILKRQGESKMLETSTSRSGIGMVNEQPEREFTLYGFAPVFERTNQ